MSWDIFHCREDNFYFFDCLFLGLKNIDVFLLSYASTSNTCNRCFTLHKVWWERLEPRSKHENYCLEKCWSASHRVKKILVDKKSQKLSLVSPSRLFPHKISLSLNYAS